MSCHNNLLSLRSLFTRLVVGRASTFCKLLLFFDIVVARLRRDEFMTGTEKI